MTEIEALEARWGVRIPDELKTHLVRNLTFEGFCGENAEGEYVRFYDVSDNLAAFDEFQRDFLPAGFVPLGGNGGGEIIVYREGVGYGLLPSLHDGPEDFILVAETLEGFWQKSLECRWFD